MVDAIPAEVHKKSATNIQKTDIQKPVPSKSDAPAPDLKKPDVQPNKAPVQQQPPVVAKPKSTFVPLVFGGVIAGAIGFAIASTMATSDNGMLSDQIRQQARAISDLEGQVAGLNDLAAAQDGLSADLTTLNDGLADVSGRLAALENLPRGEGISSVPAIVAYEAELQNLRAQITDMTDIAQTELGAARAEAAAIEENAAAAARAAAARAALARLRTGMENGAPLGAALADLEDAIGGSAPDALLAAQDGVPTLASLQEQFPDAARAALATARREGVSGEETGGIGGFLRNQFDVRSVTPQDGDSTDAILSRAEHAVRQGRLSDGLAEIGALPEVARADLSDWLAQAEIRADAIAAVDILSTSLSDN